MTAENYSGVKKKIENLTDSDVEVNYRHRLRSMEEYEDILNYTDNSINLLGTRHTVEFVDHSSGRFYCEAVFCTTKSNPKIGITEWIKVADDIRQNGLGSLLREQVLDSMGDITVYSRIINDNMVSVARNQGFTSVPEDDSNEWFVRR